MSQFPFIQMPPDGTGKRSSQQGTIEIHYNNATDLFSVGDTVTTDTGLDGDVVRVDADSPSTGEIYVRTNHGSSELVTTGESLKVEGNSVATASQDSEIFYTQEVVISGGNSPFNSVRVDDFGSIQVNYASGDPLFDAFGKLQSSESTTIREYQPIYDELPEEFTHTLTGGGAVVWNNTRKIVELNVTAADGDSVSRRTNLYHKYQTGVATTVLFSGFMSAADKAGVEGRMGLFDDRDGVFFSSEEGGAEIVLRSSVTGTVTETHFPQDEWSLDRLDGSNSAFNISGKTLDMTKTQVMFIDFQWLGAGRVRFGFIIDGALIVCHEIMNANLRSNPYMRTGSLPLSFEIENTSGTASPTSLYIISAAVKCEGKFTPREWVQGGTSEPAVQFDDDTTYEPLLSIRAAKLLAGEDNRAISIPQFLHVTDVGAGTDAFMIELVKNDTLGGPPVWVDPYPGNALESTNPANGATTSTGGEVLLTEVVRGGVKIDMTQLFGLQSQLIIRKADINATPDHYTVRVKPATAAGDVLLLAGMTWKEIR
jgi:hypothetical protein